MMEKIIGQFIMNNKGNFSLTETFTTESPYWEIRNDRILYIISDRRIDTGEETYRKEISVCMSEEEAQKNECGCYYRILKSSEEELNERRNK